MRVRMPLLSSLALCAAVLVPLRAQASVGILFHDLRPAKQLWVTPGGSGDGSREHPLGNIQRAVDEASPGTAIMVKAGEYHENVKFPAGGSAGAPVWLISADGPAAARIVVPQDSPAAIAGFGVSNLVVKDFFVQGGKNGIEFTQKGHMFRNLVANVLIEGNTVREPAEDGIKVSQADNVQTIGNTVITTGQECVDYLAVNNSVIAYNDVSGASGAAGIMVKGGSTNVVVADNNVHDIPVRDGILMGGWTQDQFFVPGFTGYEAKNLTVTGNEVHRVAKRPLNVLGAVQSRAFHNYLEANPAYDTAVNVGEGSPKAQTLAHSADIEISDNIIANKMKIKISPDSDNHIAFHDNKPQGSWDGATGLAALRPFADKGVLDLPDPRGR